MEYIWFYEYPITDKFYDYDKNYFKVYFNEKIYLFKNLSAAKRFIRQTNLFLSDMFRELQQIYFENYRVFLFDVLDYEHKKKLNDISNRILNCFVNVNKPYLKHYILERYIMALFDLVQQFITYLSKKKYKVYADFFVRRLADLENSFANYGAGLTIVVYVKGAPTISDKTYQQKVKMI